MEAIVALAAIGFALSLARFLFAAVLSVVALRRGADFEIEIKAPSTLRFRYTDPDKVVLGPGRRSVSTTLRHGSRSRR